MQTDEGRVPGRGRRVAGEGSAGVRKCESAGVRKCGSRLTAGRMDCGAGGAPPIPVPSPINCMGEGRPSSRVAAILPRRSAPPPGPLPARSSRRGGEPRAATALSRSISLPHAVCGGGSGRGALGSRTCSARPPELRFRPGGAPCTPRQVQPTGPVGEGRHRGFIAANSFAGVGCPPHPGLPLPRPFSVPAAGGVGAGGRASLPRPAGGPGEGGRVSSSPWASRTGRPAAAARGSAPLHRTRSPSG